MRPPPSLNDPYRLRAVEARSEHKRSGAERKIIYNPTGPKYVWIPLMMQMSSGVHFH